MTTSYPSPHYEDLAETPGPLPHPYLREAKLFISGLAPDVRKEDLAEVFRFCVPYRPVLNQDESGRTLPGGFKEDFISNLRAITELRSPLLLGHIDFRELAAAEKALATLQNRPLPPPAPSCNIVLSPFPPTTPPTSLPPPAAFPRLIKQLPFGISDSQLYDLFRPFGPLANARSEAGFGPDIGIVEFWREEDAHRAEAAMHGAEVGDHAISMEVYQPRRAPGSLSDFNVTAAPFVPASALYQPQAPQQQSIQQYNPNVSQPSHYFPTHFLAIPPPVTPQPFSNIFSLSSPPLSPYASAPHPLPTPQSPQPSAQQLSQYMSPTSSLAPAQSMQQQMMAAGEPYSQVSGQSFQMHPWGPPPPSQSPPLNQYYSPPMTPQRQQQQQLYPMQGHSHSPIYSSPLSGSPHSSPSMQPFGGGRGSPSAYSPYTYPYTPPHVSHLFNTPPYGGSSPYSRSPPQLAGAFLPGPGQQVQFGSGSHSGLIDPCNLFIKNLDLNIDSNDLFTHFRSYGQIVSARVMRTETGASRGFGFVSYHTPDQASHAMSMMNGALLGTKAIAVRLHEPKQLRQEKLATRFSGGRPPHPRSGSGATSPSLSEVAEFNSPLDRNRRSSGSYYQVRNPTTLLASSGAKNIIKAALSGTLNLPMRYEELSSLSPIVRKEVLTGELTRRLKGLGSLQPAEVDTLANSLTTFSLAEVIEGIHNPDILSEQVNKLKAPPTPEPTSQEPASVAPSSSGESSQQVGSISLASTPAIPASAPDHPSTPLSYATSIAEPARTSSPAGSIAIASEKDKLLASVTRIHPGNAAEITDLLLSLTKKERAMCLFNAEYLKNKVAEAVAVLEADDDAATESVATVPAIPITPLAPAVTTPAPTPTPSTATNGNGDTSSSNPPMPQTPELSSKGPSAVTSPASSTPNLPLETVYTLSYLARLSALEIIKLASSPNATGLPLPKADPEVTKATDEFIDALKGQSEGQKKQVVGQKLFKVVKAFGIRNPKVTIHLVDTEDLRALAHLMNSYPSVLKEKVLQATAATTK
ncbi:hypothetical protein FRB98_007539 [Tulasnella sp. 332]|nr:hypothetical protein FRB98_007539 [Tulasnella sp. 332]